MDRKKFPASLATHYLSGKVDMFNEWLAAGGDWSKVSLSYERKVADRKQFKRQRKGMKSRDIIATYGEKKPGSIYSVVFWMGHLPFSFYFV